MNSLTTESMEQTIIIIASCEKKLLSIHAMQINVYMVAIVE